MSEAEHEAPRRWSWAAPRARRSSMPPPPPTGVLTWTLRIFVGVSLVILFGAELGHRRRVGTEVEMLAVRAQHTVDLQRELASERLRISMGDTLIAASHTDLEDWVRDGSPRAGPELRRLEDEFVRMSNLRGVYYQIRLLGPRGRELVRVNRIEGRAIRVPADELQGKYDRYYFREAARLPRNVVYVSPLDPNVERGEVELPIRLVVRFATPVRDEEDRLEGVVVLNYEASDLLQIVRRTESNPAFETIVLDHQGRELMGPEREARSAATDHESSHFELSHPAEWRRVRGETSGQFRSDAGIFTFATVDPQSMGALVEGRASVPPAEGESEQRPGALELVHRIPASVLDAAARQDRRAMLLPLALLEALALLGAAVIARLLNQRASSRQELQRRAEIDPLTGAWNRRKLLELLDFELCRARRFDTPLSLALLDLDHFKRINDELGHPVGDEVLSHVAERMMNESREVDAVARYGGEEFVMLFPMTDEAGAVATANRVRESIADSQPEALRRRRLPVTASIGVAQYLPGESIDELLSRADDALYAAKRGGRNRTVASSSIVHEEPEARPA